MTRTHMIIVAFLLFGGGVFGISQLTAPSEEIAGSEDSAGTEDLTSVAEASPAAEDPVEEAEETADAAPLAAPTIDAFSRDADGRVVIAGRAPAGARVEVVLSGDVMGDAVADPNGAFVIFASVPPSDQPQSLMLRSAFEGDEIEAASPILIPPSAVVPDPAQTEEVAEAESVDEPLEEDTVAVVEAEPASGAEDTELASAANVDDAPAEAADVAMQEDPEPVSDATAATAVADATMPAEDEAPADAVDDVVAELDVTTPSDAGAVEEAEVQTDAIAGAPVVEEAVEDSSAALAADAEDVVAAAPEAVDPVVDGSATGPAEVADPVVSLDAPDQGSTGDVAVNVEDPVAPVVADAVNEETTSSVAVAEVEEADSTLPVVVEESAIALSDAAITAPAAPQGDVDAPSLVVADTTAVDTAPAASGATIDAPQDLSVQALGIETAPSDAPEVVAVEAPDAAAAVVDVTVADMAAQTEDGDVARVEVLQPVVPMEEDAPDALAAPEIAADIETLGAPDIVQTPAQLPVLLADAEGVRVLQPALSAGVDEDVLRTVALDTISYDAAGDVQIGGRASGGGTVRIYLNNLLIKEEAVQPDGTWQSSLTEVETGVYTMRVDQVAGDGAVLSRIETPFQREERATIAAVLAEDLADGQEVAVRTVQPGNTLWGISQDRYGDGFLYVRVFEANRDLIRDPNLIYPGQILRIPEEESVQE